MARSRPSRRRPTSSTSRRTLTGPATATPTRWRASPASPAPTVARSTAVGRVAGRPRRGRRQAGRHRPAPLRHRSRRLRRHRRLVRRQRQGRRPASWPPRSRPCTSRAVHGRHRLDGQGHRRARRIRPATRADGHRRRDRRPTARSSARPRWPAARLSVPLPADLPVGRHTLTADLPRSRDGRFAATGAAALHRPPSQADTGQARSTPRRDAKVKPRKPALQQDFTVVVKVAAEDTDAHRQGRVQDRRQEHRHAQLDDGTGRVHGPARTTGPASTSSSPSTRAPTTVEEQQGQADVPASRR